jgi:hypothetical protein
LQGIEYIAKYNLGYDVLYTPYHNSDVTQNVVFSVDNGDARPVWDAVRNLLRLQLQAPQPIEFTSTNLFCFSIQSTRQICDTSTALVL